MMMKYKITMLVVCLLAILSLILLSACDRQEAEPPLPFVSPEPVESTITISLYFSNDDASGLILERREVSRKNEPLEALVLRELIRGPSKPEGVRTVPSETRVISVQVVDRVAYANFSREIVTRHPGGSTGEQLTISSIVYSLTELPGIEKVQLLLEGEKVESMFGHITTFEPIGREVQQPHQGSISSLVDSSTLWLDRSQPLAGPVTAVAVGNVTGSSQKDIVAAAGGELYVFAHNHDGYRLVWQMAFDRYVTGIAIADLNGDGYGNIVVVGAASGNWNPNVPGFLSIFSFAEGHLSKRADISKENMPFWSVTVMHLEGNSHPEILATNGDGMYVFSYQDVSLRQLHHLSRFAGTVSAWEDMLAWRDSHGTQVGLLRWVEGEWQEAWMTESRGEWLAGTPSLGVFGDIGAPGEATMIIKNLQGDYTLFTRSGQRGEPPETLGGVTQEGDFVTSPVIGPAGDLVFGQNQHIVVFKP